MGYTVWLILGTYFYTREHGMANPITLETLKPNWSESLQFIPAIIYGMLGFELISASSEEMKNPARDVPRAVLISGLIIISLYTLATVAMLAAIPSGDVDLVEGLIDTLRLLFGTTGWGGTLVTALGIFALYTFFSNGVTWALGCNRAAAEAAMEKELPHQFAIEGKRGTPIGAAIMLGIVATIVLLLYGAMAGSQEDLFWSLFAFSAVIFLLPYLGMFLAFIKTRKTDPDHPRPFKIPGGIVVAQLLAWICFATLSLSIVLFIYTPGEGIQWPVLLGASGMLALGEVTIRIAERQQRTANNSGQ